MSLLRHEGNKTGIIARVVEMPFRARLSFEDTLYGLSYSEKKESEKRAPYPNTPLHFSESSLCPGGRHGKNYDASG
jgi:hypothetical protein